MTSWKEYLESTKYQNLPDSPQKKGEPRPAIQLPFDENQELIDLPEPHDCPLEKTSLLNLFEDRETIRKYKEQALTLSELSYLLWVSQGVKTVNEEKGFTKRIVPSAGARHPFETYLLVNNVEGLKQGLYRYLALEHKLLLVEEGEAVNERITDGCLKQKQVRTSAVTFCWVAVIERTYWRYSERSLRYILLDAGHVCQNLYLGAESIGCGVCAIAAYDDDLMNAALGLDGVQQFTAYIASLGKKE